MSRWFQAHNKGSVALCVHTAAVVWSLSRVWRFCSPKDCSQPGPFVHGISQARMLEWAAISFSRRPSCPRDGTRVSCIAGDSLSLGTISTRSKILFTYRPFQSVEQRSLRYALEPWSLSIAYIVAHVRQSIEFFSLSHLHEVWLTCWKLYILSIYSLMSSEISVYLRNHGHNLYCTL